MENYTMAELGVFIGVLGGVLTTLILTLQKSKCETIDLLRCACKRKIIPTPVAAQSGSAASPAAAQSGAAASPAAAQSGAAASPAAAQSGAAASPPGA